MKQLFKTTLLAATIAATCGSAVAGTVSVTKQTHSMEGLAGVTATQTSNAISYVVAAAYAVGDKITFTFPTGALVSASFPSQVNVGAINHDTPGSAIAGMALGLLNSDADSVTYRVTSLSQPTTILAGVNLAIDPNGGVVAAGTAYTDRTTINAAIPLGTVGYTPASVLAAAVTVTVSSQTSVGDNLDSTGTRTATVAEAKTQFGTAVANTSFDGVIDVSAARKLFVTPPSTTTTMDSMMWTITNPTTTGWSNLATVNATGGTVATTYGVAGKMTGLVAANWSNSGTRVFNATAASLTTTYNGQVTNDTVTFTAPGTVVLETQAFTTDLVYNYSSAAAVAGSKTIATGLASGEWTLNGATVNIPYMPYSASASQIMYVSNAGTQAGDILVTAFDDAGNMYDLGSVGTAAGKTVTKIATFVRDGLAAKGFTAGKVSITVTVNAPAADITVYASYNIGGADRGFVNTDQYKGMK